MLTTTMSFRLVTADIDRSLVRMAKAPGTVRSSTYYLENIGNVRSIDEFLKDERLYSFAMKAFGLGDMTYAKGLIRKVLEEGVDEPTSIANKLADKRYKDFAAAFNFARYGEATTSFGRTQQGTVDRFVRQALEEDAGRTNEGVRLALYFERKAAAIKNPYDILADRALLKVVQTATGLSPLTSAADIDKQAAMISARLDVQDLKNPEKLKNFMLKFTSLWDAQNSRTSASAPSILLGQTRQIGLRPDLLGALQNLRLGGI